MLAAATTAFSFAPSRLPPNTNNMAFQRQQPQRIINNSFTTLQMSSSSTTLPEIGSMRVGELKKELESYGISTRSFLEKSELVDAVEKARAEGKTPKASNTASSSPSSSPSSSSSSSSTASSSSSSSQSDESREEKLAKEMENCQSMKAGELKKELESYGISTKSFFEKSEFVKACAEARVDGAKKTSGSSSSSSSSGEEGYAEYADVEVLTDDASGPRKKSSEVQNQSQGGGGMPGGNPFGGGGGMPGGMGGMGGIADMMKNMGGMGGGGMPGGMGGMGGMADMMKNMGGMGGGGGGGGGGNPFGAGGDQMKKAQELMSNPKVREIMMKAQSNPKVMKAVQECMSNPMAFAKYQNDPEIGELIRELQQFM